MSEVAMSVPEMPKKRPIGRPSYYDPAYCEQVIELGKAGKSLTQISAALDIPKTTLIQWGQKHQEFQTALTRAKELEQAYWEELAMDNIKERQFQSSVWAKSMQARFRDDYTERRDIQQTTQVIDMTPENSDMRKVARAILSLLEHAKLDSLPPIIDASADEQDNDSGS